jgi:spermidine synthase
MHGLHLIDDEGFGGYTVMDDHDQELLRHMEGVLAARGMVLKTGLGMGCFVRMCLLKSDIEHIDVIEINPAIAAHFGAEFVGNPRVTIHVMDAFDFPTEGRSWDFVWHDIYTEGNDGLAEAHARLMVKFAKCTPNQGAWQFPREFKRMMRERRAA